jgi:two-component system, OmpR family, KDP operon response regulator KdpE
MTSLPLVLIVDDEPQIQRFLRHSLAASGYDLETASGASEALRLFASRRPDIVVLDLGLPDMDGKAVIGQIRQTSQVPIIVLSARDAEGEKIAALDLGANDYVVKPFAIGELLARIRACLRAAPVGQDVATQFHLGDVLIDPARHLVTKSGNELRLTPKEFELLLLLARHRGRVLTHRHILEKVWGVAHREDVAYLRVFISQLRQKIEDVASEPKLILTEPGIGYRAAD